VIAALRPGPEPPFGLPERLRALDARLGLLFLRDGRWAITFEWSPTDPRRLHIQRGTHPPNRAFDIICILPSDCPLEQAPGYLETHLRRQPARTHDVDALLLRMEQANAATRDEILRPTLELAEELIQANAKTLFSAEGKTLPRTPAPRGGTRDEKRLRDFFHDTGVEEIL
jgi:hypothetical protein